jgi:hypothetical protein
MDDRAGRSGWHNAFQGGNGFGKGDPLEFQQRCGFRWRILFGFRRSP